MPNRLAHETSPYLLQHANNPVDWHPWGPEALERAKLEDKPIFLSIGYSACHWCHVMEHESFENDAIAAQLNANFVCIKVDREERPDLDQVYMNAVQIMTGRGGWPMSVFLTPDLQPFYGGTYWPPTQNRGMPGFDQVLHAVTDAWQNRRQAALEQASDLTNHLRELASSSAVQGQLDPKLPLQAAVQLERAFDHQHGGFGAAPKFPHPMDLRLLLRVWRREQKDGLLRMVSHTLQKMAAGGMYDQLGGGFHRYSVDERWLVPHFEKMLYDNALLTPAYLEAYQATGLPEFARVARETCDYVLREMTDKAGGFYSTQDADSEGVEGKFFVWTPAEVAAVLGEEQAKTFCYVYDVSPHGNFEHANILNLPKTLEQCAKLLHRELPELESELAASRSKLLAVREKRIHPGLDDKVIVSWNGLMIDALAQAAGVLDEPRYLKAAAAAADFLLRELQTIDGRLLHTWRHGKAKLEAYLDDYTCLANSLVSLYEASFDQRWLREAVRLADRVLERFADREQGGFFYTAADQEMPIARQRDLYDNATPSGNAMAATLLVRLAKLTGRADFQTAASGVFQTAAGLMQRSPMATGQMLLAYDFHVGPTPEIVIVGNFGAADTQRAISELRHRFVPNKVVALREPSAPQDESLPLAALMAGKSLQGTEPTIYLCENFTCQPPVLGVDAAVAMWKQL